MRDAEPSLYRAVNPWDEITTPPALSRLFARGGVETATALPAAGEHTLERPEAFWDIVLGSGYRGTIDALRPEHSEAVRGQQSCVSAPTTGMAAIVQTETRSRD